MGREAPPGIWWMTWKYRESAPLKASMINADSIFLNAEEIGYEGTEWQKDGGDPGALERFETIRAHGALKMGLIQSLGKVSRQHTEGGFVSPQRNTNLQVAGRLPKKILIYVFVLYLWASYTTP